MIPDELHYTSQHEWVKERGTALRVGITYYAQDQLGDIVYVQLPDEGATVTAGEPLGEVESTKSVSDIYAPFSGTVVARNDKLGDEPELINADPYGAGWLVEIEPTAAVALDELLDAQAYAELTGHE